MPSVDYVLHRGGVKLEFVRNSFDSIRKFAVRLIRKGKKYSKNLMKINWNSICSIRLQLQAGVKFSEIRFVQNSFDSIRKFANRLIREGKKYSKNSMKINSKFVRFDLTPKQGGVKFLGCWICLKFVRFDSKIYDSMDLKGQK